MTIKEVLLKSKEKHPTREDGFIMTYKDKKYSMWPDYKNECWVYSLSDGTMSDTSFEDNCVDNIVYDIEQNGYK